MSSDNLSSTVDLKELSSILQGICTHSRKDIISKRKELFQKLNGDLFYALKLWPLKYQRMFWMKPISDKCTLQLFLFLCGNGCPPLMVALWIIYSQFWDLKCVKKRFLQLKYLMDNYEKNRHRWFYFDMHTNVHRYLSGKLRSLTSDFK